MSTVEPLPPTEESWPHKLNKALIAVGIIAFGLVVADRLMEVFRADDPPAAVANATSTVDNSAVAIAQADMAVVDVANGVEQEIFLELDSVFGSKVVFVSATEPGYLVTADDRRYDVGSAVDEQMMLAGVTAQQVFIEKAGDLIVISLPEPTIQ